MNAESPYPCRGCRTPYDRAGCSGEDVGSGCAAEVAVGVSAEEGEDGTKDEVLRVLTFSSVLELPTSSYDAL